MPPPSACPAAGSLRQLLDNQLPNVEARRLEDHVVTCVRCVRQLAEIAGEPELIASATNASPRHPVLVRLAARRTASQALSVPPLPASFGMDVTRDSGAGPGFTGMDETLNFLGPPRGPGEMGWLGSYRVLRVLGIGGMGTVYEAEDQALRRRVALKTMKPSVASSAQARERFAREARAAAALNHDRIVPIYQVGEDRGVPFLAMPMLHGEMLAHRLERVGRLPLAEALRIGREIAEGLAVAHNHGIIHRDIKPGNIWLELPGDRVKILDFGLSCGLEGDVQLTSPGAILGTPAYMAPEQAGGSVDHRADLFSLGCVLYRMVTGRLPFPGNTPMESLRNIALEQPRPPRELNPEIPPALSQFLLRLLAKEREQRPVSAPVVARVLLTMEQQLSGTAVMSGLPQAVPLASQPKPRTAPPAAQVVPLAAQLADPSEQTQALPPLGAAATASPSISRTSLGSVAAGVGKNVVGWFRGLSLRNKLALGGGMVLLLLLLRLGVAGWGRPPVEGDSQKANEAGHVENDTNDPNSSSGPITGSHAARQVVLPSPGRVSLPPVPVGEALEPNSLVLNPTKIEKLRTWDIISDQVRNVNVFSLSFLRDGRLDLAFEGGGWMHLLWDFKEGLGVSDPPFGGTCNAIRPDLTSCARMQPQSVHIFEKDNPEPVRRLLSSVDSVAWSNGGDYVATFGNEGVCVWEPDNARRLGTWREEMPSLANVIKKIVWASDDRSVLAWWCPEFHNVNYEFLKYVYQISVPEGKLQGRITVEEGISEVRVRPQGDVIAVQSATDAYIRLYKLAKAKKLHVFRTATSCPPAWSPDGELLAIGVNEGIQIWDCKTLDDPKLLLDLKKLRQRPRALVFAPHGDTLCSYDGDGKLRLWDVQTGKIRGIIVFLNNNGWLAATPEGHYRASPGAEDADLFRYRAIPLEGKTRDIKPAEFKKLYQWVNDPDKPLEALR